MSTLKKLKGFISSVKGTIIIAIIFLIVEVCSEIAIPYFLGLIIDKGISYLDRSYILNISNTLAILLIIGVISGISSTYYSSKVSSEFGMNLREGTFDKIQGLSFKNIDELNISNLIDILTNDITELQNYLKSGVKLCIKAPFLLIGSFILGILLYPQLFMLHIGMIIIVSILLYLTFKKSYPLFFKTESVLEDVNQTLSENLNSIKTVKTFSNEDYEEKKFTKLNDDYTTFSLQGNKMMSVLLPLLSLCTTLPIVLAIYFIGNYIINTDFLVGKILSFTLYTLILNSALVSGLTLVLNFTRAKVLIDRISNVITTKGDITYSNVSKTILPINGDITFENVSFEFDSSDGIKDSPLKNINFSIKAGEFIALIGNKDSGKITIANMIPRFYDPSEGKVYIDGNDIRSFNEISLRKEIGIYLNSKELFQNSVHSDISSDNLDAIEDNVTRLAKTSQVKSLINIMPNKYEDSIYEDNKLLNDEANNIEIERNISETPKIIILDDNTSDLKESAKAFYDKAINKELKETTIIMVANNISSIINADKIFLVDKGQIIMQGTHSELMNNSIHYQTIYNLQFGEEK